jgi:hypothetical protein
MGFIAMPSWRGLERSTCLLQQIAQGCLSTNEQSVQREHNFVEISAKHTSIQIFI